MSPLNLKRLILKHLNFEALVYMVGFFLAMMLVLLTSPHKARAEKAFGDHPGYVNDVQKEKHTIDTEVVLIDEPAELNSDARPLFDDKLTKEFKQQFEFRFGKTEIEQTLNSPGRFDEYYYYTGQTVGLQEHQAEQRRFGEYMGRRLIEHHADQWAKSNPDLKQVYELKDTMTNLNVEVKQGYKMDVRYSLSGGHLDFILKNPYDWDSRIRIEGGGSETIIQVGGQVNRLWGVYNLVRFNDGIVQVIGVRRLTSALSLSLTGSLDSKEEGQLVKQDLFLVGFTYAN